MMFRKGDVFVGNRGVMSIKIEEMYKAYGVRRMNLTVVFEAGYQKFYERITQDTLEIIIKAYELCNTRGEEVWE